MSEVSPLYPQQPTSKRRSPLSRRLRLFYPQEQISLVVPPDDRLLAEVAAPRKLFRKILSLIDDLRPRPVPT